MDEFISVCPNAKPASCLENFRKFSANELQGILKQYHENIPRKKADLLMRTFAIFCCVQPKLQSQKLPSDSFMYHTTCCSYKAVFSCELSNAIWKNDTTEVPNFNFFQLYHYFVVIIVKGNGDLLQITFYKRLKSFQFFHEGHVKTMELCTTELFIYVNSTVKPSVKNKGYNVRAFFRIQGKHPIGSKRVSYLRVNN